MLFVSPHGTGGSDRRERKVQKAQSNNSCAKIDFLICQVKSCSAIRNIPKWLHTYKHKLLYIQTFICTYIVLLYIITFTNLHQNSARRSLLLFAGVKKSLPIAYCFGMAYIVLYRIDLDDKACNRTICQFAINVSHRVACSQSCFNALSVTRMCGKIIIINIRICKNVPLSYIILCFLFAIKVSWLWSGGLMLIFKVTLLL